VGNTFRKNVIIVGAGASAEFNLPVGNQLKDTIAQLSDIRFGEWGRELVSGSYDIVRTLESLPGGNVNDYLGVAWKIRDNMPLAPSIDNFLDTHSNNARLVEFGKLAITSALMSAEKNSTLYIDRIDPDAFNFKNLSNTWLAQFFTILVAQRNFEAFLDALTNITFISFNYDRCIYQFFTHAAQSYFGLENNDVLSVIENLNIIYPYGNIGDFSWSNPKYTNYGKEYYGEILIEKSKQLRTFTEGTDSETIELIDSSLQSADSVLFMGFGFLNLNMELLFENKIYPVPKVLATGKGLSANSINELIMELGSIFRIKKKLTTASEIIILDKTCSEMIFEFNRYLST